MYVNNPGKAENAILSSVQWLRSRECNDSVLQDVVSMAVKSIIVDNSIDNENNGTDHKVDLAALAYTLRAMADELDDPDTIHRVVEAELLD